MAYRICYDEIGTHDAGRAAARGTTRTEYYPTEHEALHRARELFETADREGVALADDTGNVVGGFRLQLRLGYSGE